MKKSNLQDRIFSVFGADRDQMSRKEMTDMQKLQDLEELQDTDNVEGETSVDQAAASGALIGGKLGGGKLSRSLIMSLLGGGAAVAGTAIHDAKKDRVDAGMTPRTTNQQAYLDGYLTKKR